jgi:hypothetical protein
MRLTPSVGCSYLSIYWKYSLFVSQALSLLFTNKLPDFYRIALQIPESAE